MLGFVIVVLLGVWAGLKAIYQIISPAFNPTVETIKETDWSYPQVDA